MDNESQRMFGRPLTEILKSVAIEKSIMGTPSGYCFGCCGWPCNCRPIKERLPKPEAVAKAYERLQVETVEEGRSRPLVSDRTKTAYAMAKRLVEAKIATVTTPEEFMALVDLLEKEV